MVITNDVTPGLEHHHSDGTTRECIANDKLGYYARILLIDTKVDNSGPLTLILLAGW